MSGWPLRSGTLLLPGSAGPPATANWWEVDLGGGGERERGKKPNLIPPARTISAFRES